MRSRCYPSGSSPSAAAAWQRDLRADLFRLLGLEDLVAAAIPLHPEASETEEFDGYYRFEATLSSTTTRRMVATLTLPDSSRTQSVPAVVCIHGHEDTSASVYEDDSIYKGFAGALAGRGFATIAVDVGQHEVYEPGRLLMGERLWDLMRCVDYLEAMPKVNTARIGCAGLSLGGEMAMWLGAMDERIAAEFCSGFLTTMDQMESHHCMCWKFNGLRELVDFADIYALTAPRALMCQNGLQEQETHFHVPLARHVLSEIEPAYRDLAAPHMVSLDVHEGGHEIELAPLLNFFEQYLR